MPAHGLHADPTALLAEGLTHGYGVVVKAGARIDREVSLGSFVVIEPGASIGPRCSIGNHVTICAGTNVGEGVRIADFAYLGARPQLAATSTADTGELPALQLSGGCSIGSHTVVMAGTRLGERALIGDGASVRERCQIGDGAVVGRGVTVENDTSIGARTKIQSGAYITAYATIEEDAFVGPMVLTTNDNYMGRTEKRFAERKGCTIRRGARVGGGSHILPGIDIGEEAFIATGSVVTHDVPARTLVMGTPARPVRQVPTEELLEEATV